jgi:hypothetical protein
MFEQTVIMICGVTSVYLSQDRRERWRRWACLIGLTAQPFWLYATFKAEQWGIFALAFVYAWGWSRGIKTYWMK